MAKIKLYKTFRYCVKSNEKWQSFTGGFKSVKLAERWYIKHGYFFECLGYELKLLNKNSMTEGSN